MSLQEVYERARGGSIAAGIPSSLAFFDSELDIRRWGKHTSHLNVQRLWESLFAPNP
jgi:hypothetical protein